MCSRKATATTTYRCVAAPCRTFSETEPSFDKNEYKRSGRSLTNFSKALPAAHSDFAQATIKDPYNFDFLGLEDDVQERAIVSELEDELASRLSEASEAHNAYDSPALKRKRKKSNDAW